MEIKILQ